jgi:hypothetical protein
MSSDPNDQLGPFVEGLVMGAMDFARLNESITRLGWRANFEELDRHAVVFVAPSGKRWRIVAELIPEEAF